MNGRDALPSWLADALAATDIDGLELMGPGVRVRLARRGGEVVAVPADEPLVPEAPAPLRVRPVTSPVPGIVLHRHPLHAAPLAPDAQRVRAGQPLVLLRIGSLLLPVVAPCGAAAAEGLAPDGSIAGYGTPLVRLLAPDADPNP